MSDNITLPREVIVQAVKVLSPMAYDTWPRERNEVVATLRAHLAAPQPEPVAWLRKDGLRFLGGIEPSDGSELPLYAAAAAPEPEKERAETVIPARGVVADRKASILTPEVYPEKRHPGYVIGNHWLETAYERLCAGEAEAEVLKDCGWERVTDAEALRRDAELGRWIREETPPIEEIAARVDAMEDET